MNDNDLQGIRLSRIWRKRRIESRDCEGQRVMVKGQRPARDGAGMRFGLRFLRALAFATGMPLLMAMPMPGGEEAQETEVRRLRELHTAGIRVPEVLHVDREFFVMEHLRGPNVAQVLATDPVGRVHVWEDALYFILDAHRRGQYFSQAYARNFLVAARGVAAVDLEDDPLRIMPLAQAQARDWLMYLHSTVWLLMPGMRAGLQSVWDTVVQADDAQVVRVVRMAAGRLAWMRHLPDRRRPWGRDVIATQAVAAFLHGWMRSSRSS